MHDPWHGIASTKDSFSPGQQSEFPVSVELDGSIFVLFVGVGLAAVVAFLERRRRKARVPVAGGDSERRHTLRWTLLGGCAFSVVGFVIGSVVGYQRCQETISGCDGGTCMICYLWEPLYRGTLGALSSGVFGAVLRGLWNFRVGLRKERPYTGAWPDADPTDRNEPWP